MNRDVIDSAPSNNPDKRNNRPTDFNVSSFNPMIMSTPAIFRGEPPTVSSAFSSMRKEPAHIATSVFSPIDEKENTSASDNSTVLNKISKNVTSESPSKEVIQKSSNANRISNLSSGLTRATSFERKNYFPTKMSPLCDKTNFQPHSSNITKQTTIHDRSTQTEEPVEKGATQKLQSVDFLRPVVESCVEDLEEKLEALKFVISKSHAQTLRSFDNLSDSMKIIGQQQNSISNLQDENRQLKEKIQWLEALRFGR